ncbi:MAG: ABC transporter ATP-binding protein [Candidatus Woesearchaeota archaeon]
MSELHLKENLKQYIRYVVPYWPMIALIAGLTIIIEVSSILDKYIFKFFIDRIELLINNSITREEFISYTWLLLLAFFAVIIIHTVTIWFSLYISNRVQGRVMTDVKRDFYDHTMHLAYDFHTTHNPGKLISRLTRGASASETITDSLAWSIFPLIIQFLLVIISLLYVHWILMSIVIVVVILYALYSLYLEKIQIPARLKLNEVEDTERTFIADSFTNVETIKYFGKESMMNARFKTKIRDTYLWFVRKWDYFNWFQAGQTFIVSIGVLALIGASAWLYLENSISLGDIVFAQSVFLGFVGPLYRFTWYIRNLMQAFSDFESLMKYRRVKFDIKDKPHAQKLNVKRGKIVFENIRFNYQDEPFMKKFSLLIKPGEKVALVGHSGSGKSTLVKLLYRLYDPLEGKITIDNTDIASVTQESLRQSLSIVPQEGILFDDTLYNNILFVKPNAKKSEVMYAIEAAQLTDVIERLPNKENTIVGERGIKLSGGERQRVAIARGILAHTKILILDEATSALDSQTEIRIQKALHELLQEKTSIIIAHRLSTIMNADRIIVLDNGKIIQEGKHKELIKKKGPYKKLWQLQKEGYIVD